MRAVFGLTVLGGVGLLTLAAWPGAVEEVVLGFCTGCLMVPLLGVWAVLLVVLAPAT